MRTLAATSCGLPGSGDCCVANDTPHCEDEACCTLICAKDPFCCQVEWDTICADAACQKCHICECPFLGCGDSAFGDCCEANNSPYCDDEECCKMICAQDPFCCQVEWDSICADAALGACDCDVNGFGCGVPGYGDCCEANNSPFCDNGPCCECICACDPFCCDVQWDSLCAGKGVDGFCGASNPNGPCTDECSRCVGGPPPPPPPPGDCEGDVTGDGTVGVPDLLALVDAWGPCADPANCPADLNGDGVVGIQDLFILLGDWGCEEDDKKLSCGDPAAGSCFTPNDTPYCDFAKCCELVCAQDPFCCDVMWDALCVNQAFENCPVPGD